MDNKNNTGNWNTGNRNTGGWNTGNWNNGDFNAGDGNTGNCNTGEFNTGDSNAGAWNTGYCNAGHRNAGKWNTGNCNTGDWNTGNHNTGFCNSISPEDILVFNRPAKLEDWKNSRTPAWMYVELTKWIGEEDMTEKEKEAYPSYTTTGGYLKVYDSLKQAYVEAWEMASKEERELTFKLPNYDEEVFKEVFGFTPRVDNKVKVVCEGKEVWLGYESAKALNLID